MPVLKGRGFRPRRQSRQIKWRRWPRSDALATEVTYLFYVLVKFACYAAWCWLGLRLWQPASSTLGRAAAFGLLRLAIGVAAGVSIFIVIRAEPYDLLWKYLEIYTPVRMVEWFILALIMLRAWNRALAPTTLFWCAGGILVSFVADLASPEGVSGHFCVGRCLC
jgi:hypothetical protein